MSDISASKTAIRPEDLLAIIGREDFHPQRFTAGATVLIGVSLSTAERHFAPLQDPVERALKTPVLPVA